MRLLLAVASVVLLATAGAAQTPQDQWFTSNGVRIRYVEQGTGEPVLLVHGYPDNVELNWIETGVFQDLAKDHHVIAFDMRGFGKSDKLYDPSMYGAQLVQDAIRLLDHLGIQRAHIVGYSFGASVVAKLATTNPDRFITATLGGSAGYRNWKPQYDSSAARDAVELESDVPFRSLVVAMTPRDEPKRTEEDVRARSAKLAAENDVKALAAYKHAGTRAYNSTDSEVAAIKVPVLGVVGSLDNVQGMKQLQTLLPSLKLVVIDGATHWGDRGAPRRSEFTAAIREFVAAHPSGQRGSSR